MSDVPAAESEKPTPGPWFAEVSAIEIGGVANVLTAEQLTDEDAEPVAGGIRVAADAHLIAAAPELVDALERIELGAVHPECAEVHASGDCQCSRLIARDALARARGAVPA